jgi:hypothetical protein
MFQGFLLLLGIYLDGSSFGGDYSLEAEQAVDLLRRVRHDFSNHLQVIGGYLEMGQPEQVKEYLRMVMEEISSERIIFQALHGESALYFYEQLSKARDMGIILRYEDLDIDSWDILKSSDEPCHSMADLCRNMAQSDEEPLIYLSIYEDERGIDMLFTSSIWGSSSKVIRINKE